MNAKKITTSHMVVGFFLFLSFFACQDAGASLVKAKVVFKIDLSSKAKDKEAKLWLPYPVSDNYQLVSDIRVSGTFEARGVYTDRRYKTPVLYLYWSPHTRYKIASFSFDVERAERKERADSAGKGEGCVDRQFFKLFLQATRLAPVDPRLQVLAKKITKARTDVFSKAKAIYDWVTMHMRRNPKVNGCGNGDVCMLLNTLSGKCADIHSVFVALLKASGIPAREVFGLRLSKDQSADITTWQHCWAEFYLPGYGWFVSDPGDYLKALLVKGLDPQSDRARKLHGYFFGTIDPYRVRLSIGRDIELNPKASGSPLNYLMYPYAEIEGLPIDYLSPREFSYRILQEAPDGE